MDGVVVDGGVEEFGGLVAVILVGDAVLESEQGEDVFDTVEAFVFGGWGCDKGALEDEGEHDSVEAVGDDEGGVLDGGEVVRDGGGEGALDARGWESALPGGDDACGLAGQFGQVDEESSVVGGLVEEDSGDGGLAVFGLGEEGVEDVGVGGEDGVKDMECVWSSQLSADVQSALLSDTDEIEAFEESAHGLLDVLGEGAFGAFPEAGGVGAGPEGVWDAFEEVVLPGASSDVRVPDLVAADDDGVESVCELCDGIGAFGGRMEMACPELLEGTVLGAFAELVPGWCGEVQEGWDEV